MRTEFVMDTKLTLKLNRGLMRKQSNMPRTEKWAHPTLWKPICSLWALKRIARNSKFPHLSLF